MTKLNLAGLCLLAFFSNSHTAMAISSADLAKINEAVNNELNQPYSLSLASVAQAGRLRTLSSSISTHVSMVARAEQPNANRIAVGQAALALEDGLKALIFGNAASHLAPIKELDALNQMQAISERWTHLRERLIVVLSGETVDDALLQQVTALGTDLSHSIDAATTMLELKVPEAQRAKAPIVNVASRQMMWIHALINEWLLEYDFEPVIDIYEEAQKDLYRLAGSHYAPQLEEIDILWQRFKTQLGVKSINPEGRMTALNARAKELLALYENLIEQLIL